MNSNNSCMPGVPYYSRGVITDGTELEGGWFINLPYPNAIVLGPFMTEEMAQREFDRWDHFRQVAEAL